MSIHDDPEELTGSGVKAEPVVKKGSHPKVAIQRPKRELAEAQVSLAEARVELIAATSDHRKCELALGAAVADYLALTPGPTYDEINRERLAKDGAARLERVKAGLPANPASVYEGDKSPLSLAALARGRRPTTPLRSPVVRR